MMAYKGDTVKYRISSPNGTWRNVDSLEEAEQHISQLLDGYRVAWVAVDRIETTRVIMRKREDQS
jgi:hypothetical protein